MFSCKEEEKKVTPELLNFPQSATGTADIPLPIIVFDTTTFDFGSISEGEKVVHSYTFVNNGKSPLIISQVEPSCGCTALKDWPQSPISPGESGKISVEFNSSGKPGLINKSIFVQANTVPATTMLYIKGEVKGPGTGTATNEKPIFEPGEPN
jgi:hypothetical protein